MKVKNKKIIYIFTIILITLITMKSYAREIGQLTNFSITGHSIHRTGFLLKQKDGHYIMNLNKDQTIEET